MSDRNKRWRAAALTLALLSVVVVAACSSSSASEPAPSRALAVAAQPPHPLTFYEGGDDREPFTPFFASRGPNGTVVTMGFANNEGAYYLAAFDAATWNETDISNGFAPGDPLWDCDESPDTEIALAPDTSLLARPCADGSVTIFSLPDAVMKYHATVAPSASPIASRVPSVAFAPQGGLVAITDDGPSGAGQHIMILSTQSWQQQASIAVAAGLLSRPAWSPDGSQLAAVDLSGTLRVWSASGQEVASAPVPRFTPGAAATDPAGPAPQWSPDGAHLYATAPSPGGTVIAAFTLSAGGQLSAGATATIPLVPNKADPQLSPDGTLIFAHSAVRHGQIFTAPGLVQTGDFALAGALAIWGPDSHSIDVFNLRAQVIPLQVGG